MFDRKQEIKDRLEFVMVNRGLISTINEVALRSPSLSDLASEAVKGCQQTNEILMNEIRRIRNGETKLY